MLFVKKNHRCVRVVAMLALLCSTMSDYSHAVLPRMLSTANTIIVHEDCGKVVQRYTGNNTPFVYCIEDMHCNKEAQKKIAAIIQSLQTQNPRSIIGIEGSTQRIDVSLLQHILIPTLKNDIVEKFLDIGYMSGAEVYAVHTPYPMQLFGLEDAMLYRQGLDTLYDMIQNNTYSEHAICDVRRMIRLGKDVLYSDAMQEMEAKKALYQAGALSIHAYCAYLERIYNPVPEKKYPQLYHLKIIQTLQQEIDTTFVAQEAAYCVQRINASLDAQERKALHEHTSQYYECLEQSIQKRGIQVERDYPLLGRYLRYLHHKNAMDERLLFVELEQYEYEVAVYLVRHGGDAQRVLYVEHMLNAAERMINQEGSRHDAALWNTEKEQFYAALEWMCTHLARTNEYQTIRAPIEQAVTRSEGFYAIAVKRDAILVKNIVARMVSAHTNQGIMVVGGFHSDGVTEVLRSNGIGYAVIRPVVSHKNDKRLYYKRVKEQVEFLRLHTTGYSVAHARREESIANTMMLVSTFETGEAIAKLQEYVRDVATCDQEVVIRVLEKATKSPAEFKEYLIHSRTQQHSIRRVALVGSGVIALMQSMFRFVDVGVGDIGRHLSSVHREFAAAMGEYFIVEPLRLERRDRSGAPPSDYQDYYRALIVTENRGEREKPLMRVSEEMYEILAIVGRIDSTYQHNIMERIREHESRELWGKEDHDGLLVQDEVLGNFVKEVIPMVYDVRGRSIGAREEEDIRRVIQGSRIRKREAGESETRAGASPWKQARHGEGEEAGRGYERREKERRREREDDVRMHDVERRRDEGKAREGREGDIRAVYHMSGRAGAARVSERRKDTRAINRKIIDAAKRGEIREIIAICERDIDSFDAVNIAIALHRLAQQLARSSQRDRQRFIENVIFERLIEKAREKIGDFNAQGLSNTAWAIAKLGIDNASARELMDAIASEAVRKIGDFHAQELSNTAWAIAKLGRDNEPARALMTAIASVAVRKIGDFHAQELSNTAWAFAKVGRDNEPARALMDAIASVAVRKIDTFNAQALSNTAWAFAKVGRDNEPVRALMTAIASVAVRKIGDFHAQELSNTTWAFATCRIHDDTLMAALVTQAIRKIDDFNAQGLSNTAWAIAKLGIDNASARELMDAIASVVVRKIGDFHAQELSNIAWAFATCRIHDDTLMAALVTQAIRKIDDFNAQGLSNTAWAFATCGIYDDTLMAALVTQAIRKIDDFKAQELSNTAWAFATLGIPNDALMGAIARAAVRKIGEFNAQDVSNMAWAMVVVEYYDPPLFDAIIAQLNRRDLSEFADESVSQLHQMILSLEHDHPAYLANLSTERKDEIANRGRYVREKDQGNTHQSNFQREVLEAIRRTTESTCSEEYLVENVGYPLDIAFVEQKIDIEADGLYHFVYSCDDRVAGRTGADQLRQRLLEYEGWRVIHVPYYEWGQLDDTKKTTYVRTILTEAGIPIRAAVSGAASAVSLVGRVIALMQSMFRFVDVGVGDIGRHLSSVHREFAAAMGEYFIVEPLRLERRDRSGAPPSDYQDYYRALIVTENRGEREKPLMRVSEEMYEVLDMIGNIDAHYQKDIMQRIRKHEIQELAGHDHTALLDADGVLKAFVKNVIPALYCITHTEKLTKREDSEAAWHAAYTIQQCIETATGRRIQLDTIVHISPCLLWTLLYIEGGKVVAYETPHEGERYRIIVETRQGIMIREIKYVNRDEVERGIVHAPFVDAITVPLSHKMGETIEDIEAMSEALFSELGRMILTSVASQDSEAYTIIGTSSLRNAA